LVEHLTEGLGGGAAARHIEEAGGIAGKSRVAKGAGCRDHGTVPVRDRGRAAGIVDRPLVALSVPKLVKSAPDPRVTPVVSVKGERKSSLCGVSKKIGETMFQVCK
jgi:hypothetical protein